MSKIQYKYNGSKININVNMKSVPVVFIFLLCYSIETLASLDMNISFLS